MDLVRPNSLRVAVVADQSTARPTGKSCVIFVFGLDCLCPDDPL
jgi:hypothetical protein